MKKVKWILLLVLMVLVSLIISLYLVENVSIGGLEAMVSRLESMSRISLIVQIFIVGFTWVTWPTVIATMSFSNKKRNELMKLRHHVCFIFALLLVLLAI
ncbi:hypothetical protein BWP24_29075 (plasmid) [Vibrio campbellii]|nr:hypothetical protein BWP24_29075 [Vibrio campbellii]